MFIKTQLLRDYKHVKKLKLRNYQVRFKLSGVLCAKFNLLNIFALSWHI